MNSIKRIDGIVIFILSIVLLFSSCKKDDDNESGSSTYSVRMTDAPGPFDEVNIDIQGVEVKSNKGTYLLNVNAGVYNLLNFVNGTDTLIATAGIPSGTVSQVRLILGNNNSVKIAGVLYPLATPSAQESGLKINLHTELSAGVAYILLLDFDAGRSIVETGNGQYILKPVIRAVEQALGGSIHGSVSPVIAKPLVVAAYSGDTLTTSSSLVSGEFLITAVPAGVYTVTFYPVAPYSNQTVNNVTVTTGNMTEMGTINF